jgi:hypothetical protein
MKKSDTRIQIIIESHSFNGTLILPEHKVQEYLKQVYKNYIKNMTADSFMKISFTKL